MSASPPSHFAVVIHVQHSAQYASKYLSAHYPPSISALLQPVPLDPGPSARPGPPRLFTASDERHCAVLTLPNSYPSGTPLSDIRYDLKTWFQNVPIHPSSSFRRHGEGLREPEQFDDGATVGHAWVAIRREEEREEAEWQRWTKAGSGSSEWSTISSEGGEADDGTMSGGKNDREKEGSEIVITVDEERRGALRAERPACESTVDATQVSGAGEIHLDISTTAGHLAELDEALPMDFRHWRRYAVGMNYLLRESGGGLEDVRGRGGELGSEIAEFQSLERECGEDLRRKLIEWEELVCGHALGGLDVTEMRSREERETDIDDRMQKWSKIKGEMAAVVASEPQEGEVIRGPDWEPPDPEEDLLFPAIPPVSSAPVMAVPLARDSHGGGKVGLPLESSSFTVRSGALLWGQLQTVFDGSKSASFDGTVPPPSLPGGTILQRVFNYRAAARNGLWRVRRAYSNTVCEDGYAVPLHHFGHVVHHESVDPMETLWRCAGKGWSEGRGGYAYKDILEIGRYDWSWLCTPSNPSGLKDFMREATGLRVVDEPHDLVDDSLLALRPRWGGFCMLADADEFGEEFLQAFVRDCPTKVRPGEAKERLFVRRRESDDGGRDAIGAWMACEYTEYEFGWLIFSGKKHDVHIEADELVAIVYDGTYDRLEGTRFSVDD